MQPIPVTVSRYDALAPLSLSEFTRARENLERGNVNDANAGFERLFERLPDNILVGTWLQEAELAASTGGDAPDATATATEGAASITQSALAARWSQAATAHPTVANFVLAARVAPTREEATTLLAAAEVQDAGCAWVPYARAWLAARASEWPLAHEEVARAKAADPGHLWTYWLEAWMTTRSGAVSDAAAALTAFVDRATDDPRVLPRILAESQLDLALMWTLLDEGKKARALIQRIDTRHVGAARRLLALASIEQALGELGPALAAAEEAQTVAPGQVLPVLQQALLYDDWLDEPEKAGAAWKRVLEIARSSPELSSVLERTRAGVRIERYEQRRAKEASTSTPSAGSAPNRP